MPTRPPQHRTVPLAPRQSWNKGSNATDRVSGRALQKHNYDIKVRDRFQCRNKQCQIITHELEVDHILPLALGGLNCSDNEQCLCLLCHSIKSRLERGGMRLSNPSDFPIRYEAARSQLVRHEQDGDDDGEWGDILGLYPPGGIRP